MDQPQSLDDRTILIVHTVDDAVFEDHLTLSVKVIGAGGKVALGHFLVEVAAGADVDLTVLLDVVVSAVILNQSQSLGKRAVDIKTSVNHALFEDDASVGFKAIDAGIEQTVCLIFYDIQAAAVIYLSAHTDIVIVSLIINHARVLCENAVDIIVAVVDTAELTLGVSVIVDPVEESPAAVRRGKSLESGQSYVVLIIAFAEPTVCDQLAVEEGHAAYGTGIGTVIRMSGGMILPLRVEGRVPGKGHFIARCVMRSRAVGSGGIVQEVLLVRFRYGSIRDRYRVAGVIHSGIEDQLFAVLTQLIFDEERILRIRSGEEAVTRVSGFFQIVHTAQIAAVDRACVNGPISVPADRVHACQREILLRISVDLFNELRI